MKRFLYLSIAALVLAGSLPAAAAESTEAPVVKRSGPGQATSRRTITLKAKVTAIDPDKRLITLQGKSGKTETYAVDPAVKRLNEIAVGDVVVLKYEQALLLQFQPADEKPAETSGYAETKRAEADQAPAAGSRAEVRGTVTVSAVDPKSRVVVFQTPKGELVKVKADKSIDLSKVKAGQKYFGVYNEAVALSVEKAGQAKAPAKAPAKGAAPAPK
jgi:hypothetical protein